MDVTLNECTIDLLAYRHSTLLAVADLALHKLWLTTLLDLHVGQYSVLLWMSMSHSCSMNVPLPYLHTGTPPCLLSRIWHFTRSGSPPSWTCTLDSVLLWMSHSTNVPLPSGPTRVTQQLHAARVSNFPVILWPGRVHSATTALHPVSANR